MHGVRHDACIHIIFLTFFFLLVFSIGNRDALHLWDGPFVLCMILHDWYQAE